MDHHHHDHGCAHCACHNPILNLLKDELFTPENFESLPKQRTVTRDEQAEAFMVTGGTIRPMINGAVDTVAAIGFAGGKVVVTGTEAEVSQFMQSNYPGYSSRELLAENTLLPGLIEPHVHLVPTAMLMGWTDLGGFYEQVLAPNYDINSVAAIIKKTVKHLPGNFWFLGANLDPALMPLENNSKELLTIDADLLDSICIDKPVLIISASMHTFYANTMALELIYYNPANYKLIAQYPTFDIYKKKTKGQLQEAAGMDPALKALNPLQKAQFFVEAFLNLKKIFETANSRGVTFMYDAGMDSGQKSILKAYLAVNDSTVRIGAAEVCNTVDDANKLPDYTPTDNYEDIFVSHIKVISDGSNQGLTGYQSEPYLCNPADNYGIYNFADKKTPDPKTPPTEVVQLMQTIIGKSWPVMIHANGDLAVQFAIQAFRESIVNPDQGVRHRIEHCSLTTAQNLDDMKDMMILPSFLIGHVGYWGYAFKKAIFGKKSEMLDLCSSALKLGMKITLHSDNSVSPLGPLRMMEQSITRRMEGDPEWGVLNLKERITHEQGLTAITYDAAWQCYAEQWVGSLQVGNFADFVVLETDPLTMKEPYMKMRDIKVLETWVGGVAVYENSVSEAVGAK